MNDSCGDGVLVALVKMLTALHWHNWMSQFLVSRQRMMDTIVQRLHSLRLVSRNRLAYFLLAPWLLYEAWWGLSSSSWYEKNLKMVMEVMIYEFTNVKYLVLSSVASLMFCGWLSSNMWTWRRMLSHVHDVTQGNAIYGELLRYSSATSTLYKILYIPRCCDLQFSLVNENRVIAKGTSFKAAG